MVRHPGNLRGAFPWGSRMVDRNAEVLAEQLLTWPTSDRARLAALLLASLEPSEADAEAAWDLEVDRRAAELDEIGRAHV